MLNPPLTKFTGSWRAWTREPSASELGLDSGVEYPYAFDARLTGRSKNDDGSNVSN